DTVDHAFIERHTTGFAELKEHLRALPWQRLENDSGLSSDSMRRFADDLARARSAVFVYSMGLTQHRFGVDNVKALVNLALARGFLGREQCGVMPIRGHSGVQGGGECGVDPDKLPGGFEVSNAEHRARFEALWGAAVPAHR